MRGAFFHTKNLAQSEKIKVVSPNGKAFKTDKKSPQKRGEKTVKTLFIDKPGSVEYNHLSSSLVAG